MRYAILGAMYTRLAVKVSLAFAAIGALAGCSTDTVNVQSNASSGQANSTQSTQSNKFSDRGVPGVPYVHEAAGGPIPAEAREIATLRTVDGIPGSVAVFTTPTGNIDCSITYEPGAHSLLCGVESYKQNFGMGSDRQGKPKWVVAVLTRDMFSEEAEHLTGHEPGGGVEPEVVPYGTIVSHGPFACAVEDTGVTCWDSRNGRGAWIEREGTFFFDPIDYQIWEHMNA